ncbi:MAG: transglycosylase SLT domain-containing protein [Acidiferrobacterales bacterium]
MACTRVYVFLLLGLTRIPLAYADSENAYELEQQRRDYVAAQQALQEDDLKNYDALLQRLDGYVLQGYLRYEFLKTRIDVTPKGTIRRFLDETRYAPISASLRRTWLRHLVRQGDWDTFIKEYPPDNDEAELECYRLDYLLENDGNRAELRDDVEVLWLTGARLPAACNAVFRQWHAAGYLNDELVWARIERLMRRGRLSLARELGNRYLNAHDRTWLRRWQKMYRHPAKSLRGPDFPVESLRSRTIIKHGIVRLAYRDPAAAMKQWRRLKDKHAVLAQDDNYVRRRVGIAGARRHDPAAVQWLAEITDADSDPDLRLWRLRTALRAGDWELAKRFVATLTEAEQADRFWWYWTARVMEQTNEPAKAGYLFALVARERHYYGFLAADRIDTGYTMQHSAISASHEELDGIRARAGVQAARELYAIGDAVAARRQWNWAIARMSGRELEVAARVASDWGWPDRAIYTLSKSGHRHDLGMRFPLIYRDLVESNAKATGLDPSWIYGVMRQESAFVADARSSAGALGLMQLMPSVGRMTGRRIKLKVRSTGAILEVENNVRLGVAFLKNMLQRYDGHQMLATAAYNAGLSRVRAWLPQEQTLDADVWIETIPYDETRDYIKNVMAYAAVYDHRLDRDPIRLCRRMPAVGPNNDVVRIASTCPPPTPAQQTLEKGDRSPPDSS